MRNSEWKKSEESCQKPENKVAETCRRDVEAERAKQARPEEEPCLEEAKPQCGDDSSGGGEVGGPKYWFRWSRERVGAGGRERRGERRAPLLRHDGQTLDR